eukprot:GHVU01224970.1.p3 GENE.GHVU01224970.1~~GHVU01224970.1.p3  ORF type:complete len:120 (-),score=5.25 GHVU01224970.1:143-502(-)
MLRFNPFPMASDGLFVSTCEWLHHVHICLLCPQDHVHSSIRLEKEPVPLRQEVLWLQDFFLAGITTGGFVGTSGRNLAPSVFASPGSPVAAGLFFAGITTGGFVGTSGRNLAKVSGPRT